MKLTPEWIVGFVDGDGSFRKVVDSSGYTRFIFVVSQNKRSVQVLFAMKEFFQCGRVTKAGENMMEFRVEKKEHLQNIIFPFFDQYPLQTITKKKDQEVLFQQFTQYHTERGTLIATQPYVGPILSLKDPVTPLLYQSEEWLAGIIDAEGCFTVSMVKNIARPQLIVLLSERNLPLFEALIQHYKIGIVYQRKDKSVVFQVNKFDDLPQLFKILKHPPNDRLHTIKKVCYGLFVEITTSWANKLPKRLKYDSIINGKSIREMLDTLTLDSPPMLDLPPDVERRRKLILRILELRLTLNKYEKIEKSSKKAATKIDVNVVDSDISESSLYSGLDSGDI